jgi:hypothetical protein
MGPGATFVARWRILNCRMAVNARHGHGPERTIQAGREFWFPGQTEPNSRRGESAERKPACIEAHRFGPPETVSPCCWNSTCREGRRDGIGRSYATRPYLGNERCQRDSPRICLRRADSAGSLASLRRRHRFDRHCITVTLKPASHGKGWGPGTGPVHRGW